MTTKLKINDQGWRSVENTLTNLRPVEGQACMTKELFLQGADKVAAITDNLYSQFNEVLVRSHCRSCREKKVLQIGVPYHLLSETWVLAFAAILDECGRERQPNAFAEIEKNEGLVAVLAENLDGQLLYEIYRAQLERGQIILTGNSARKSQKNRNSGCTILQESDDLPVFSYLGGLKPMGSGSRAPDFRVVGEELLHKLKESCRFLRAATSSSIVVAGPAFFEEKLRDLDWRFKVGTSSEREIVWPLTSRYRFVRYAESKLEDFRNKTPGSPDAVFVREVGGDLPKWRPSVHQLLRDYQDGKTQAMEAFAGKKNSILLFFDDRGESIPEVFETYFEKILHVYPVDKVGSFESSANSTQWVWDHGHGIENVESKPDHAPAGTLEWLSANKFEVLPGDYGKKLEMIVKYAKQIRSRIEDDDLIGQKFWYALLDSIRELSRPVPEIKNPDPYAAVIREVEQSRSQIWEEGGREVCGYRAELRLDCLQMQNPKIRCIRGTSVPVIVSSQQGMIEGILQKKNCAYRAADYSAIGSACEIMEAPCHRTHGFTINGALAGVLMRPRFNVQTWKLYPHEMEDLKKMLVRLVGGFDKSVSSASRKKLLRHVFCIADADIHEGKWLADDIEQASPEPPDTDNFFRFFRAIARGHGDISYETTATVSGYLLTDSGGYLLYDNDTAVVAIVRNGDLVEHNEVPASSICSGGRIVLPRSEERRSIFSLVESEYRRKREKDYNYCEIWWKSLAAFAQKHALSAAKLSQRLKPLGCDVTATTVNNWIRGNIIMPDRQEHLLAVLTLVGYSDETRNASTLFELGSELQDAHRTLGRRLAKQLWDAVANDVPIINLPKATIDVSSQFVIVEVVQNRKCDNFTVPRSSLGRLLNIDEALWAE